MSDVPVPPIAVEMVPCVGDNGISFPASSDGVCTRCNYKAGYETGRLGHRVAKPHLRPQPIYVLKDCASCSCGGWYGTPVSLERQLTGAEDLILSFQGKVDDIEKNNANAVELLCTLVERLDTLIEQLDKP